MKKEKKGGKGCNEKIDSLEKTIKSKEMPILLRKTPPFAMGVGEYSAHSCIVNTIFRDCHSLY